MYLDPGFGGMLVQIIIALVAAGGAILFALRKRIKRLFAKKNDDSVNKPMDTTVSQAMVSDDDIIDTMGD